MPRMVHIGILASDHSSLMLPPEALAQSRNRRSNSCERKPVNTAQSAATSTRHVGDIDHLESRPLLRSISISRWQSEDISRRYSDTAQGESSAQATTGAIRSTGPARQ